MDLCDGSTFYDTNVQGTTKVIKSSLIWDDLFYDTLVSCLFSEKFLSKITVCELCPTVTSSSELQWSCDRRNIDADENSRAPAKQASSNPVVRGTLLNFSISPTCRSITTTWPILDFA